VKKSEYLAKNYKNGDKVYFKKGKNVLEATIVAPNPVKSPNAGYYNYERSHVKIKETASGDSYLKSIRSLFAESDELEKLAEEQAEALKKKNAATAKKKAELKKLVAEVPEKYIGKIQDVLAAYRKSGQLCEEEHFKIVAKLGLPPVPVELWVMGVEFEATREGASQSMTWHDRTSLEDQIAKKSWEGVWAKKGDTVTVGSFTVVRKS
jgi:hypothetical protein